MWVAVVPAFIAVTLLLLFVREPERSETEIDSGKTLILGEARCLPKRYWVIVFLGAIFMLARFSEAFLVLRAGDVGLALGYVPLVMVVMNLFYAGVAYPAGIAADHMSHKTLVLVSLVLLFVADMVLAFSTSPLTVFVGAALWGLHMAFSQGLLSKLVADTAPPALLGTGFGIFNLVSGIMMLVASVIAGLLWNTFGASGTFLAGAGFTMIAAIGLMVTVRNNKHVFRKPGD
jgi:MFS family permease